MPDTCDASTYRFLKIVTAPRNRAPVRPIAGGMSNLPRLLLLLSFSTALAACTEPTPIPGPVCGDEARLGFCKDSCAADALCPGHDQWACELDCRACRVDENYCPVEPE